MHKKILPVILVSLYLLSLASCSQSPEVSAPSVQVSSSEEPSIPVSESSEDAALSNEEPVLSEEQEEVLIDAEAAAKAFSTLSDNLLLISAGHKDNKVYIFNSSGLLYEGVADLLRDKNWRAKYYSVAEKREDGQYTAVFNSEGKQVTGYDCQRITMLAENYIVRGRYEVENTDAEEFTIDTSFTDLRTGETVWEPGRCRVRWLDDEYLLISLQEAENASVETQIIRQDDLSVVKRFPDSFGLSDTYQGFPMPDGCILLWDSSYENMRLYSLYLDQYFDDFNWFVGEDCIQLGKSGSYTYVSLKTGETLYSNTNINLIYHADQIALWSEESKYYMRIEDQVIPVQYASRWAEDGSDDPYLNVMLEQNQLDILSKDGELLLSIPAKGGNSAEYLGDGWACMIDENGCVLYHVSGKTYSFDGRRYVRPLSMSLEGKLRFIEWDGENYYLLDETGKVYAESIYEINPVDSFIEILRVSDDLLDLDGNFIWSEEE